MGGTGFDDGLAVVVDGSGNVYSTGRFTGTVDFDPGPAMFNLTSAGSTDVFVSKLDSAGNLVWAVAMGGNGNNNGDAGTGVAVDGSGNVYTTGNFEATADFDPGAGTANLTAVGLEDAFVSKLDSTGTFG
ncbi:MAG: hypothetical protein OEU32_13355 [Acidimicrobiia bacterium]|nr:hypothetical protein [Acidimicrobiia bacterium]